jgi:hypothetical protein
MNLPHACIVLIGGYTRMTLETVSVNDRMDMLL